MELIDANELLKHELPAKKYSPEMLVIGKGYVLNALRYPEDGWRADAAEERVFELREALALAHAILAKMPPGNVAQAAKRAAIKHEGNDPMGYIAGVLANHSIRIRETE